MYAQGTESALDPLALELQMAVTDTVWVLGPLEAQRVLLTTKPSLQRSCLVVDLCQQLPGTDGSSLLSHQGRDTQKVSMPSIL